MTQKEIIIKTITLTRIAKEVLLPCQIVIRRMKAQFVNQFHQLIRIVRV